MIPAYGGVWFSTGKKILITIAAEIIWLSAVRLFIEESGVYEHSGFLWKSILIILGLAIFKQNQIKNG
jgi:hypothetical protein